MKNIIIAGVLAATVSLVHGHGGVWNYTIDGKVYPGASGGYPNTIMSSATIQRNWSTTNPIMDTQDPNLSCNDPGTATSTTAHAPVTAGSIVSANWGSWAHEWGPSFVYLAACNGPCGPVDATKLKWFKIAEVGLLNGTWVEGTWGNTLIYNGQPHLGMIPKRLKPGYYMVRHEVIAIHTNVQHFMECAQLEVLGEGTEFPTEEYLVQFPGGYKNDDPGLMNPHGADWFFATYAQRTDYPIPGPKIWSGSG